VEIQQPADRQAAHAQIGLQLHVVRRNRLDFQDNSLVRQDIGGEAKRKRLPLLVVRSWRLVPKRQVNRPTKSKAGGHNLADVSVGLYPLHRWNAGFAPNLNAGAFQLATRSGSVKRLQQPRTSVPMHFDRQPDNTLRQFPMMQYSYAPWPSDFLRDKN